MKPFAIFLIFPNFFFQFFFKKLTDTVKRANQTVFVSIYARIFLQKFFKNAPSQNPRIKNFRFCNNSFYRNFTNRKLLAIHSPVFCRILTFLLLLKFGNFTISADNNLKDSQFNPITTGVTSLSIPPDARGAALGYTGVASDPDANSQFWNPAKYAFSETSGAMAFSYTPWMHRIVNDIFLVDLAGFWSPGRAQSVSASLRYFSLGEVSASDPAVAGSESTFNPYEMAFDIGYSRRLSDSYSMGVVLRYIYSDLGFNSGYMNETAAGASAFAADISGYLTTYPIIGRNECQWSLGWNISDIGTKVNYDYGVQPAFLPATLRIGTSFKFPVADYHNIALSLDLNKLLVPARPRPADFDMTAPEGEIAYLDAVAEWEDRSSISAIFKSFSDAPGGFKEELKEINIGIGAEYGYNDRFFVRAGFYHENRYKSNSQYFTSGVGLRVNAFRIDAAYTLSTARLTPLDSTLRFTLTLDVDALKALFD